MICITCATYYKKSIWNNSMECDDCYNYNPVVQAQVCIASNHQSVVDSGSNLLYNSIQAEDKADVDSLPNPTGKTIAVFYD